MKKFKGELTAEVQIIFAEPEKAKAEFIDGDWRNVFWDIDSMEELTKNIAFAVHSAPERWIYDEEIGQGNYEKNPEGFGDYIKTEQGWVMDNEHTGKITVIIDDLEVEIAYEDETSLPLN